MQERAEEMSADLNKAEELLEQAHLNGQMAEVRHNALREAFEQRECDLESYLSTLRDWLVAQAEVTVAEFRVHVLEPPTGDGRFGPL